MAKLAGLSSPPMVAARYISFGRQKTLAIERILLPWFVVLIWGIPYPFRLVSTEDAGPGLEAALNNVLSERGILLVLAWAGFGMLVLLRTLRDSRFGFLRVLFGHASGGLWFLFLLAQVISILFSPSPLLCTFRVFQSIVLYGFLIHWFYLGESESRACLIRVLACYAAVNAAYNLVMFVVYPDAVMVHDPIDGDRLIGGWLFVPDYAFAGLIVFTFSLASLFYVGERRLLYALGLALGLGEMAFSATRGVAFCAVAILCLVPVVRSQSLLLRSLFVAGAAMSLLLIYMYADDLNTWMGRSAQTLQGLDGRSDIWSTYLADFFRQGNPIFGLGYLTGGRYLASQYPENPFGNLHNMYLEALVDTGMVGLVALVGSLVVLLLYFRLLTRWQSLALGSRRGRFACRDFAFCWLCVVSAVILGIISNSLLEENAVMFSVPIGYMLVVASAARERPIGRHKIGRCRALTDPCR